jgi:hypothetical protein
MKTTMRVVPWLMLCAGSLVFAQEDPQTESYQKYRVTVTNLTRGQGFGLPLVYAHDGQQSVFEVGMSASPELAVLAEDGNNMPLAEALKASSHVKSVVAGTEPILPGKSMSYEIMTSGYYPYVGVAGMLGTTNDTFGAVTALMVPRHGKSMDYGVAYDAGSERNSELCKFIPGPPCGNPGVRDTEGAEGYVYVSSGIHGIGDLPEEQFDWRNPVIRVTIERI